jgi:hypothetical protein
MDAFAKEKVALETKNKGVAEADRDSEDVAEETNHSRMDARLEL